jgi:hypothetical protein
MSDLVTSEFEGHFTVAALRQDCRVIPSVPGVYIVRAPDGFTPTFLETSRGGHFKKKDPTMPVGVLKRLWVEGTSIVYIGQAGGGKSAATLRERIRALLRFGAGEPVGHRGGRALWQVDGAETLIVSWRALSDEDPRVIERAMIRDFSKRFGKRPFANLQD